MHPIRRRQLRNLTYSAVFFLTFYTSLTAYINSSFLSSLLPEKMVGMVFAIGSIITILALQFVSDHLPRHGLIKLFNFLLVISIIIGGWLALSENPLLAVFLFIAFLTVAPITRLLLDIYLEQISSDTLTGQIRGVFMTVINTAWLLSPLAATWIIGENDYRSVYLISSIIVVPTLILSLAYLRDIPTEPFQQLRVLSTLGKLATARHGLNTNLRNILIIDFLLNFFYSIMVIYIPLYLHNHIGLPWDKIGFIFTLMLVPFVLLVLPLGRLADKKLGEKEILMTGLVIASFFTLLIPFINSSGVLAWAVILIGTRIGAASIEIMKETYLFKKIGSADTAFITLSRIMPPLSYVVGPVIGSLVLFLAPMQALFMVAGLIMFLGLYPAGQLEDTN